VILEVSKLVERLTTVFDLTDVWSLTSMNTKVIEEVVPFFKRFRTSIVHTKHIRDSAIGQRILGLENQEILSLWYQAILLE